MMLGERGGIVLKLGKSRSVVVLLCFLIPIALGRNRLAAGTRVVSLCCVRDAVQRDGLDQPSTLAAVQPIFEGPLYLTTGLSKNWHPLPRMPSWCGRLGRRDLGVVAGSRACSARRGPGAERLRDSGRFRDWRFTGMAELLTPLLLFCVCCRSASNFGL